MQQATTRTLRKIYWFRALNDFVLLYPLYGVMFAEHGLSTFKISTLFILWSVTDLITNVPTGVLADKFSRKNLLALGQLITAVGFALWFILPNYTGFALGFVFWGVGGALFDGTFEALVYDELKTVGQERQYVKVIGRSTSYALVANFTATALAAAAVLLGYGFVIGASVLAVVAAAAVAFTLPETRRFEQVADTRYFSMLRQGILQAIHNRTILGIILLGGFIGCIYGSLEEYVPLFFRSAGFNHSIVPLVVATTVIAAALASLVAHRYEHLRTTTFMGLLALSGLLLLAAGTLPGISSIFLLVFYTFLIKLLATIFDGKLQHSITGGLRATITSVSGFAMEILSIMAYLVYGLVSRHGGNIAVFKVTGVAVTMVALVYWLASPRLLAGPALPVSEE